MPDLNQLIGVPNIPLSQKQSSFGDYGSSSDSGDESSVSQKRRKVKTNLISLNKQIN